MRITLAAMHATRHLEPLLGIAYLLRPRGHEVSVLTWRESRERVEATRSAFAALPLGAYFENGVELSLAGHGTFGRSGALAVALNWALIRATSGQFRALASLIRSHRPNGVIADHLFLGAVALVPSPLDSRPSVAACEVTSFEWTRKDGLPGGDGMNFVQDRATRDAQQALATLQAEAAVPPLLAPHAQTRRISMRPWRRCRPLSRGSGARCIRLQTILYAVAPTQSLEGLGRAAAWDGVRRVIPQDHSQA